LYRSLVSIPPGLGVTTPLELFRYNDEYEDQWVGSSTVRGYPPDPSYPSDSRSVCEALTPKYRGGQNPLLSYLDIQSFHGVNGNNTAGGVYYDWDGTTYKTPFIVDTADAAAKAAHRADWYNWLFPQTGGSNYVMRGLKQLYEANLPFADEYNPTVKEFEDWSLLVLNHFRTLMSLDPVTYDQSLFIQAQLSNERKTTSLWDSYTGTLDSAYGPCIPGTNIHCGATFVPGTSDQQPYWNDYNCNYPSVVPHDPFSHVSNESEAIGTFWNGNAMTAMSRVIRNLVNGGNTGGHAGPFLFRPNLGYAISGTYSIRSKWTGTQQGPPSGFVIA
jgi:hypothetical protein